ncbi:hypothetical protein [Povalibacter sp.]|uniref:hypothetical protein n=1 Tax=Povalibacter sp. TaxID=1962978 RepID=UPI002F42E61E
MVSLRLMLRALTGAALLIGSASVAMAASGDYWQSKDATDKESYVKEPMPPGIQVIQTELEGPVFADEKGKTIYNWPLGGLRNGNTGDRRNGGVSNCTDTIYTETTGYMSPYPGGFLLPDLDKRRPCEQLWPPVLAAADAKPVGKWTLVKRKNGANQWAYNGYPVYTSDLDRKPGDVLGGTNAISGGAQGIVRNPVNPTADIPPELAIVPFRTGRMITTHRGASVYVSDADEPGKSNCTGPCLQEWAPVLAPMTARSRGDWGIIERSPGIKQWAFRGKALYTNVADKRSRSMVGSDFPGWHNAFTQRALPPPAEFTVHDARLGQVLADANGKTIYIYQCNDDAMDQQTCDHPDAPQVYRMAICGNFDPKVCQKTFPYLPAAPDARADSSLWTVMTIDPETGRKAQAGQPGAMTVWAYRERPVYTYGDDQRPGDTEGDSYGEFNGARNGFRAYWLRDDFRNNSLGRTSRER